MQDEDDKNQQPNNEEELVEDQSSEQEETAAEEPAESTEQETAEDTTEEETEEAAPAEQPESEEPKQPSRRESLRIQQLVTKLKDQATPESPAQKGVDFRKLIDADEEVYQQLDQTTQNYGKEVYNAGLEQAKSLQFHTRLEIDAPRVEAKHPQLDKTSQQFKPALSDAVNSMYLAASGYDPKTDTVQNPSIRYADYVEAIFELGNEIAGTKTETTRKNIIKQAANTGLRPDGSQAKRLNLNKPFEEMTDDELQLWGEKHGLATPRRK